MINHPIINYALAILNKVYENVTNQDLIQLLESCKMKVSLECILPDDFSFDQKKFTYTEKLPNKNERIILSPSIITTNLEKLLKEVDYVVKILQEGKNTPLEVTQSALPISKYYFRFSDNGKGSKSYAKISAKDYALLLISIMTEEKPFCVISEKKTEDGKNKIVNYNICILPDLDVQYCRDFIEIFKKIQMQKGDKLYEAIIRKTKKKTYVDNPPVFNGNFPNVTKSKYLQGLCLLGSIGEVSKEESSKADLLFEEFKKNSFYIISSEGTADVLSYNHHVIDIAKEGSLHKIVDSLYYARFYKYKGLNRKDTSKLKTFGIKGEEFETEYLKYDLYLSRFLQLFSHNSFNEFLSCRMEYPLPTKNILTKYFHSMEKVSFDIIESAEALGAWLNSTAYNVACREEGISKGDKIKNLPPEKQQKIVEKKFKFLVELESSIFSAPNSLSLISHTITRAGRLSESDAPNEARLFIKAAMSSEISLEVAKNLLIAFSRIRSASSTVNNSAETEGIECAPDCSNL